MHPNAMPVHVSRQSRSRMMLRKQQCTAFRIAAAGVPGDPGTTPGQPRRKRANPTFKNSSDGVQTPPKDLYTLHSLPVVYLNPRLVASRLAAACNNIGTLKCAKMRKRIYVCLGVMK